MSHQTSDNTLPICNLKLGLGPLFLLRIQFLECTACIYLSCWRWHNTVVLKRCWDQYKLRNLNTSVTFIQQTWRFHTALKHSSTSIIRSVGLETNTQHALWNTVSVVPCFMQLKPSQNRTIYLTSWCKRWRSSIKCSQFTYLKLKTLTYHTP